MPSLTHYHTRRGIVHHGKNERLTWRPSRHSVVLPLSALTRKTGSTDAPFPATMNTGNPYAERGDNHRERDGDEASEQDPLGRNPPIATLY